MAASVIGATRAALAPCANRAATSTPVPGASPAASDVSPNRISPLTSSRRCPVRSPIRPPSSSSAPNGSAYPVTIHCRSAAGTPNSRWIVASATLTMEKSSCRTNCADETRNSARPRRRPSRADAAVAGFAAPGGAAGGAASISPAG